MKKSFRHVRFSLKGLFAATLFVACVAATLRYATRLWTDAAFTLALAAVAVAILGAIYRTDVPQWDDLERAGHSLTALLAALAFGNIAQWFYRTRRVAVAR